MTATQIAAQQLAQAIARLRQAERKAARSMERVDLVFAAARR